MFKSLIFAFRGLSKIKIGCLVGLIVFAPYASVGAQTNLKPISRPANVNKALIESLIRRIDSGQKHQIISSDMFNGANSIAVQYRKDPQTTSDTQIAYQDGILLLSFNCKSQSDSSNLKVIGYAKQIDTSINIGTPRLTINLSKLAKQNMQVAAQEEMLKCSTSIPLPESDLYKISGHKGSGANIQWSFEHKFLPDNQYYDLNKISRVPSLKSSSIICHASTRFCFTNSTPPKYAETLLLGNKGNFFGLNRNANYYLQSRKTATELTRMFPNVTLKEIEPAISMLTAFIKKHAEHNIIISVKDSAVRQLSHADINALEKLGINLGSVEYRGSHITILRPNLLPINVSDNKVAVKVLPLEHGIKNVGAVSSAGWAAGNRSVIMVNGKNVATNIRGLNIAVIDVEGRVVISRNFDTHAAPYRKNGLYRVSTK